MPYPIHHHLLDDHPDGPNEDENGELSNDPQPARVLKESHHIMRGVDYLRKMKYTAPHMHSAAHR